MQIRHRGHAPRALALAAAVVWSAAPAAAQVVLDGTANPAFKGALAGPDYRIGAELGHRAGGNLFHSFERFGLRTLPNGTVETATFSGPDGIRNVISRVTGGEPSGINGLLRSTIPGADFFFLNPAGVVFGLNARLDVQGSFHVSTADELRFEDGAVVSATDPAASSFTVAAPAAFGFLRARPEAIVAVGSSLEAPPGETVSLVSGGAFLIASRIVALGGRVNLIGAAPGEAVPTSGAIAGAAVPGRGPVILTGSTEVDTGGDGGGAVRIRGGQFVVENRSSVAAGNTGPTPARDGIDIKADVVRIGTGSAMTIDVLGSGAGGPLVVQADDVLVAHGSKISSETSGEGDAGTVTVAAGRLRIIGDGSGGLTGIASQATKRSTGGDAQAVTVTADEIELRDGGKISSGTAGKGDAGTVTVEADRLLRIIGGDGPEGFTGIASQATERMTGDAGAVTVTAGEIELRARGTISSSTFGEGNGGTVTVEADRLRIIGDGSGFFLTGITSSADFFFDTTGGPVVPTGDAGAVTVTADEIELRDRGGEINSATFGEGDAGTVTVEADRVLLADGGTIGSSSLGTGEGGSVVVHATDTFRSTGGSVAAETVQADAGDVTITAGRLIDLEDSEVTTSAAGGRGSGGNIHIDPEFVVLDNSDVVARAREGAGGNIAIETDFLFQTPDSLIDASSELGIDGEVDVDAPDVDVTSGLVALPTAFIDASALLRPSCAAGRSERASSFIGVGRGGLPPTPEAPLPGFYAGLLDAGAGTAAIAGPSPRFDPVGLVVACGGED